jgi:hypothetical protein
MRTLVNVARYHLADRMSYVVLPWSVMAFSFLVNVAVAALVPPDPKGYYTGGLLTIYAFLLACGVLSMTRSLPFGFMLGVSRRGYYLGTGLLVAALGVGYGLGLTVLQAVERATGGWGLRIHFFRVAWLLDGPWYRTWLTSAVLLVLFFLYGMWYGLVFRRWSLPGVVAFIAAQFLAALAVIAVASWTHGWHALGRFFTTLTAPTATGLLAALAVVMGLGGFATMRRVTV